MLKVSLYNAAFLETPWGFETVILPNVTVLPLETGHECLCFAQESLTVLSVHPEGWNTSVTSKLLFPVLFCRNTKVNVADTVD